MNDADRNRLAEIGARCEKATEGPWKSYKHSCSHYYEVEAPNEEVVVLHANWEDSGIVCAEDADFIAYAREDVPWLLDRLAEALGQEGGGS